jgi:hypothetical protein
LYQAGVRFNVDTMPNEFGLDIQRIRAPGGGVLMLMEDPLLSRMGNQYAGMMFVVDMANVALVQEEDGQTTLETAIQNPGEDCVKDQYISRFGLECLNTETHGFWFFYS